MAELIDPADLPPPPPPPPPPVASREEANGANGASLLSSSSEDDWPTPTPSPSPPPPPAAAAATPPPPSTPSAAVGTVEHPPARVASMSMALNMSAAAAASTANRTVGISSVTTAAMLQASMLKKSVVSIPEGDSDSDDDLPQVSTHRATMASPSSLGGKKLSSASSASFSAMSTQPKWEVEKSNRYGVKDSRVVVLDLTGHAVRFFEREKLKSEIPLNQISSVAQRSADEPKHVQIHFREDRRSYDLYFKGDEEAAEFARLLSVEIDNANLTGTRAYSQSVQRSAPSPSSSNSSSSSSVASSSVVQFMPPSPAHYAHSSMLLGGGIQSRDASESIAIHSEVGHHGLHVAQQHAAVAELQEDHNLYLDYLVTKKNRYGMRQQRILVINSMHLTMLLLDEKRKFKKEFPLASILSVEIPRSQAANEAQCYVVFAKESGQKPFNLFFADAVDRLHFCERLVSLAPHELSIKDESDHVEEGDALRFGILKLNKVGVKKKRIVVLRTKERVLRSFNREKSYKDVSFRNILKWEKPSADRFRLNVWLRERPHPLILIFPDPVSRERFVTQSNYIRQLAHDEETAAVATPPPAAHTDQSPSSSSSSSASSSPPPLSIFIGSFNLGNAPFTYESFDAFIPSMKYDLYVIGLQECSKSHRDQWLLELRNHIQQNWNKAAATGATSVEDDKDDGEQPYALLGVVKLWEILLMVLIRRPLLGNVTNLCMDTVATGVGDVLGNKGGCGLSFTYQESNLCFVACHLAARSERVVQRAENYMKILKQLQLGLPSVDILSHNDHVFWFGDLNYRNELEYSEVLRLVKMKEWKTLCTYDQLTSQMANQLVFAGFQEAPLRFAPTYRWERKENVFSNKKFQAPSWTDRVLWHSLPGLADLKLESYSSAPNVMGSDHRPLFATFSLAARPPYTGKLPRSAHQLQPIRVMHNENPNLVTPDNAAFGATLPPSSLPPPPSSFAPPSPLTTNALTPPSSPPSKSTLGASPKSSPSNSLLLPAGAAPAHYQHYTTASNGPSPSVACRPSAAGSAGTMTLNTKNFTPYFFTASPPGPLFTPPAPQAAHLGLPTPLLGSTKEFSIVLQNVKCTFSNAPRGDFTLTASAPFLAAWPTTTAVSYPFGLEVGSHWDELILPPFIHDLYYLYTRHLLLSISVPSLAASNSGQNAEQTGTGTCIGTVSVGLGTICANIFHIVATQLSGANPNAPGLAGDHGGYYFIEPIHRDGLYCGQMEGFIKFRYGKQHA